MCKKKLKVGAGILYGANQEGNIYIDSYATHGYAALFADVLLFLGNRQKWSFGGQIGHGIYNQDYPYPKKAGIYYSVSANYRAIVSKKLQINTSFFLGSRNFDDRYPEDNSIFTGLRLGVVF